MTLVESFDLPPEAFTPLHADQKCILMKTALVSAVSVFASSLQLSGAVEISSIPVQSPTIIQLHFVELKTSINAWSDIDQKCVEASDGIDLLNEETTSGHFFPEGE